jgi:hypothetical protein
MMGDVFVEMALALVKCSYSINKGNNFVRTV